MVYTGIVKTLIENAGASEGDVIVVDSEFNGILMPHPGSSEPDTIIVKLGSGYNVGIKCGPTTKIGLVSKKSAEKIPEAQVAHAPVPQSSKSKPNIAILHTGGTIASRVDKRTGAVFSSFKPEDLMAMFPEIAEIANVTSAKLVRNMLSEDITSEHYKLLADEIARQVASGVDGIIIGHGTDTLHYTAAALSFMLDGLAIPVIFVGAQRSSDRGSSDAAMNLVCAAQFIAKTRGGFAGGVAICLHGKIDDDYCLINPGCKTRKMHSSRRDAFQAINDFSTAKVWPDGRLEWVKKKDHPTTGTGNKLELFTKMEKRVGLVKVHPDFDPALLKFYESAGYRGLVLEGTGMGHMPVTELDEFTTSNKENLEILKRMIGNGCVIVMTTQTIYGRVDMNIYSTGRDLLKAGVIGGEDMLPETAFVKLKWLIGNFGPERARELIGKNMRGEITERTLPDTFLRHG